MIKNEIKTLKDKRIRRLEEKVVNFTQELYSLKARNIRKSKWRGEGCKISDNKK